MARKSLSKRLRFEVFKRDGFRCGYCGRTPPDVVLVIDHVLPIAEGGGDEPDNLTTSCYDCNAGKGAVPLGDVLPRLDELGVLEALQEVAERRLMLRQQAEVVERQRAEVDAAVERVFDWWVQETGRPDAYQHDSVRVFLQQGLSLEEIDRAIQVTGSKFRGKQWASDYQVWRYLCGCCWGILRKGREA